jgi:hypothetical protein
MHQIALRCARQLDEKATSRLREASPREQYSTTRNEICLIQPFKSFNAEEMWGEANARLEASWRKITVVV